MRLLGKCMLVGVYALIWSMCANTCRCISAYWVNVC